MGRTLYERDSIEFNRMIGLTDGIFAVAMTLLIVSIGIPRVPSEKLTDTLLSAHGDILTFFISVAVLAFYWLSNHHFVRHLKAIDPVYTGLNLIYLGLIAFLPLPTGLLDRYSGEPITVVVYISTLLLISLMELILFSRAHRAELFAVDPPRRMVRYSVLLVLIPVLVFTLAIPVGLLSSPTYALAVWILLAFPLRFLVERRLGPSATDPYL
ncbi:MAG: TMEM175 family protein [Solirubrobacterales bacterium]|nr:TMEM175 family protein [Solirubrobacterales bacterium]